MKKSASGAAATRISPSAPTPRWRSQIAATSSASRVTRPATSSIRTKSLPVPLYLPNAISRICEVLRQVVGHAGRASVVGIEPPDPRIASEPRHLPPGELARPLRDAFGGLVQGHPSRHVL